MEEFSGLSIIVIILLLYIIKTFQKRFDEIKHNLSDLDKKIQNLRSKEILKEPETVTIPKVNTPIIPVPEKPIENTPLTTQEVILPAITPILQPEKEIVKTPTSSEQIIKQENEKVVFTGDNASAPKPVRKPQAPYVPEPSFWERFKNNNPDLEKFIGENLINKIGILILVLGISYFVKYSIDQGWIPTPARVGIGMLAGAMVLGVAHKLRKLYAAFSSVFVAGAFAIFYFTIGIAFHEYKLFGQEVAFTILVIITAFSSLITVSYNRIELGILTLIGGFAVPFMVSTGSGNYVVLFSYILVLNAGILAIAYNKKWNLLNILAFVFTWILFAGWLYKDINDVKPHYLGALLFATAFYIMFTVINIINNIKNKGEFSKSQIAMLSANTFIFYGFGISILSESHPELKGLFTTIISVANLFYAWFLYKKFNLDKNVIYLLIGLTLTFVTLAIPIQFSGHYITLFWAVEAVLLFWLSQKSNVTYYKFAAVIVQVLMLGSLFMDWSTYQNEKSNLLIIANQIFITGLVSIASCFATYFVLKKETEKSYQYSFTFNPDSYRKLIFIVGVILIYFVGIFEVGYKATSNIASFASVVSLPIVYHLLFCAVLCYFSLKTNQKTAFKLVTIVSIINIVLFAFGFLNYAFNEHQNYIATGVYENTAFLMHYVMLIITLYFGYLLYKLNKEKQLGSFLAKPIFTWIAAFFIVFICSRELMLHGLIIKNIPAVSMQEVLKDRPDIGKNKDDISFAKDSIANLKISEVKETILKTSYPVLWGILAFVFLIFGIKKPSKTIRIIALALLGLTIVKLFAYDISNVSETGKIIAFILLGVLILIISFVYQKLKVLVIDDAKPDSELENNNQNLNTNNNE